MIAVDPRPQLVPSPIHATIHARITTIARMHSQRRALVFHGGSWSHGQLDRTAAQVARVLIEEGVAPGEPVAVGMGQSPFTIAAFLGIAKAGGAWVPIDPAAPPEAWESVLQDTGARVVLAGKEAPGALQQDLARWWVPLPEALDGVAPDPPEVSGSAHLPMSIMYSSGSTGRPKGIIQTHWSRLHQLDAHLRTLEVTETDRFTLLHQLHFATSSSDVFGALLSGAELHMFDLLAEGMESLAGWLLASRATIYAWTPSAFRAFTRGLPPGTHFPDVRRVILGSEPVLRSDIEAFRRHFPASCQFVNRLGSAEAGNYAYYFAGSEEEPPDDIVPAGRAPVGWDVSVVDERGSPVPDGETGEIQVRSAYLSPGYWRRPELTEEVFRPDGERDVQVIRTGDMGRFLPDGNLLHLGRKNFQVKIGGVTIHPLEVEAALAQLPGIVEAAVAAYLDRGGSSVLAAYLVGEAGGRPYTTSRLRSILGEKLPPAAIPTSFQYLESLPRTHVGKVDRLELPRPAGERPELDTPFAPPEGPTEGHLARIWSEVLEVSPVGRHDPFLELGGSSLRAVQILARVSEQWGVTLPLTVLFADPTVAGLAQAVASTVAAGASEAELLSLLNELDAAEVWDP